MRRQPRTVRRTGRRLVLTPRDEAILRALARFRLARTSDLHRLLFDGVRRDTVAKRLRQLFDAGFIEVHSADRAAESTYALGSRGRRWAEGQGIACGRQPRAPWEHHLAIVRLWTEIASMLHGRSDWRLAAFRVEWELREYAARWGESIVPDSLAEIVVDGTGAREVSVRIAFEVDLATESARVLAQKLKRYRSQLLVGAGFLGPEDGLAVVLGNASTGRARAVAQLLSDSWPAPCALWRLEDGVVTALPRLVEECASLPSQTPLAARGGEGT